MSQYLWQDLLYDPSTTPQIYEAVRAEARRKAALHWEAMNFNMWKNFNATPKELNTTWVDPWFEDETHTNTNESPDYEILFNMYYLYCWFKFKGYGNYAITGIINCFIQESRTSGGAWERQLKPFGNIVNFDPTSTVSKQNRTWYNLGGSIYIWRPSATAINPLTNQRETMSMLVRGTWDAYKQRPIWVEDGYFVLDGSGNPQLNPNAAGYQGAGGGYGIAQWTDFTKLVGLGEDTATDGQYHWQMNTTLQLMILEYQRSISTTSTASGWNPDGNPERPHIQYGTQKYAYQYIDNAHPNPKPMSWDYFAQDKWADTSTDNYLTNVFHAIETNNNVTLTVKQKEWMKRQFASSVWQFCYEGMGYDYSALHMETITEYIYFAIQYWDSHPIQGTQAGWNVIDIPRARDIPFCELDNYHINPGVLAMYMRRKGREINHGCTVLF